MNVFEIHSKIVGDYASYIRSFINIAYKEISREVDGALSEGELWPQPLLQFNPTYEMAGGIAAEALRKGDAHNLDSAMPATMNQYWN